MIIVIEIQTPLLSFQKLSLNKNRTFDFKTSSVMPKAYYLSLCENNRQESRYHFIENCGVLSEVGFLQCLSFNSLWFALIQCDEPL